MIHRLKDKISKHPDGFWIGILCAVLMIRLFTLGAYPLMDKTETRYAEIAREMVVTNNWITPQLEENQPFWGKPPLSFWLTALSFKIFGFNEFAARLPSALLAMIMVGLIYLLGRCLKDQGAGIKAAVILATIGLFFVSAGTVMTDPALSAAVTLSMVAFAMGMNAASVASRRRWGYLFFVGLGLSLLAKGPVGVVLVFIPVVLWSIVYQQFKLVIKNLPWFGGLFLTIAIALPWYLLAEKSTPGFLDYFFIGEHWERFTVKGWSGDLYGSGHAQPKGMIWLFSIPATMPWTVLFIAILIACYRQEHRVKDLVKLDLWQGYLVLWLISPMILFTLASNILIPYLNPAQPAFALLLAFLLKQAPSEPKTKVPWYFSKNVSTGMALFVPIAALIGSFVILPRTAKGLSQLPLVEIFESLRQGDESTLVYIDRMPHSADFYARGKATDMLDVSRENVLKYLYNGQEDFFAINQDNTYVHIPEEFFHLTKEVGRHKEYVLRQEISQ